MLPCSNHSATQMHKKGVCESVRCLPSVIEWAKGSRHTCRYLLRTGIQPRNRPLDSIRTAWSMLPEMPTYWLQVSGAANDRGRQVR